MHFTIEELKMQPPPKTNCRIENFYPIPSNQETIMLKDKNTQFAKSQGTASPAKS